MPQTTPAPQSPPARATSVTDSLIDYGAFAIGSYINLILENAMTGYIRPDEKVHIAYYLTGIDSFIHRTPNPYDPTCSSIADPALSSELRRLVESSVRAYAASRSQVTGQLALAAMAEETPVLERQGRDDVHLLAADYGGCAGPLVSRLYDSIKQYVRSAQGR